MDENAARQRSSRAVRRASEPSRSAWERTSATRSKLCTWLLFCSSALLVYVLYVAEELTLTLTADFVDELARGYSQPWFQALVRRCADEYCHDHQQLLEQLHEIAFEAGGSEKNGCRKLF